jgi:hypothetical protein
MKKAINVIFILVVIIGVGVLLVKNLIMQPPMSGISRSCPHTYAFPYQYTGSSSMEVIAQSENAITIRYICITADPKRNFDITFSGPHDLFLVNLITGQYSGTWYSTGVVLDSNNSIIQLYRVNLVGMTESWRYIEPKPGAY